MGFETDDIAKAFNIFDKSFVDKKYDVSVLTDIVFQVQQKLVDEAQIVRDSDSDIYDDNHPQSHSVHSAPNSPQIHGDTQQQQQPPPPPPPPTQYLSESRIKSKSMSASPHLQSHARTRQVHKKQQQQQPQTLQQDLLSSLPVFSKYTDEENHTLRVLLQTVHKNDNEFNNLVNWHDLCNNIEDRKSKWSQFQSQFNAAQQYNGQRHEQLRQQLKRHKAKKKQIQKQLQKRLKNKNNDNDNDNDELETPETPTATTNVSVQSEPDCGDDDGGGDGEQKASDVNTRTSALQKALQFEQDLKTYELCSKKEKLLVTANTYSILKTNKEKTECLISKCNERIEALNAKITALQNERKQYFSALMRTKNKLLFQVQSVRETETAIKELHQETKHISDALESIEQTKHSVDCFERQLHDIGHVLEHNFHYELEPTWKEWNSREVLIWMKHIQRGTFAKHDAFLAAIRESNLCGKDLPHLNDFILRSFKLNLKSERDVLLSHIQRIIQLKIAPKKIEQKPEPPPPQHGQKQQKQGQQQQQQQQLCVICSDGEANHIMIPCGHIAVCSNCVQHVKEHKKCPFCGNHITNVIKCFHVGL